MPAAAKAWLDALAARLADLLLVGPSGLGDLSPTEAVRLRNGRLMMLISTVVMTTILVSFPMAGVPIWIWPVLVAAGAGSGAVIIWLLIRVSPNSRLAIAVAVPTSLAVIGSCWIARAWFDQLPLLITLLLAAHAIYLGWRSAVVVAVLGALGMTDANDSVADPVIRLAMLLGLTAIFEVSRRSEALATARVLAAEQRLRSTLDSLAEGVRIVDRDLRHLYVNEAGLRRMDRTRDEVLGRTFDELFPGAGSDDLHDHYRACLAGEGPRQYEGQRTLPDGTTEWSTTTVERVPEGLFILSRDVTAEREAELAGAFAARAAEAFRVGTAAVARDATLCEAAASVCRRLSAIPALSLVAVVAYLGDEEGIVVAVEGEDLPIEVGFEVPRERVREEIARSSSGPWVEHVAVMEARTAWQDFVLANGFKARAHIPIQSGARVVGLIAIGTRDDAFGRALASRLPGLASISAAANVLLAHRLDQFRRDELDRRELRTIIETAAFRTVFAPIADLTTGGAVGYEALTRFADGRPAREAYARAHELGLGPELRLAVLSLALQESRDLPLGPWLQVRVPAGMLRPGSPVIDLLATATRPLVLDVVDDGVEDAGQVRDAVSGLAGMARLAVDHAGVTQVTFDHILALRPAFVNLAPRLAQGCNHDLGRQALVGAMVRFARSTGCRIVATGVATRDEAQTLAGLGVDFARGPWVGDFAPAEAWSAGERRDPVPVPEPAARSRHRAG